MTRRRAVLFGAAAVLAVALAAGLAWFQPWRLFTNHRVDDVLPAVATRSVPAAAHPTAAAAAPRTPVPPQAVLLARGMFISHEHDTIGAVSVVRQPDGSRVLAIAGLRTSDGPDLHVWLTDRAVRPGESNWYVFDDGKHISLGTLKGNLGNQLYPIPAGAALDELISVSIWCARFDVSFGAAALVPVG
ncbi:MAG: DM13 domain-containing protein [Jatrophihabitantaceae bacterium]